MNEARAAILSLLAARAPDATICPSEAARRLADAGDWRDAMPAVHAAVDALAADGLIVLSWKGRGMEQRSGPYRIARGTDGATPAGFEPAT
jgi:hypothetical protein